MTYSAVYKKSLSRTDVDHRVVAEKILLAMQPPDNYNNMLRGNHGIKTNLSFMLNCNLANFNKMRLLYREDCRTALRNVFVCNVRLIQQYSHLFRDNISKEDFYKASNNMLEKYRLRLGMSELDLQYAVIEQLTWDQAFRESAQRNPDYVKLISSLREDRTQESNLWRTVINYLGIGYKLDTIKELVKNKLVRSKDYTQDEITEIVAKVNEIGDFVQRGVLRDLYNSKEQFGLRIDFSYGNGWERSEHIQRQAKANLLQRLEASQEVFYVLGEKFIDGINYLNDQDLPDRLRSSTLANICRKLGVDLGWNNSLECKLRSKLWEKAVEFSKNSSGHDLRSGKLLAEVLQDTVAPGQAKWNFSSIADDLAPVARQAILFAKLVKENTEVTISDEQKNILTKVELEINRIATANNIPDLDIRSYSQLDDIGEAYRRITEKVYILETYAASGFIEPKNIAQLKENMSSAGSMIKFQEVAQQEQANLERFFEQNAYLISRQNQLGKEIKEWLSVESLPEERRRELEEIKRGLADCRHQTITVQYIASTGLSLDTDLSVASFKSGGYQFQLEQVMQVNMIAESIPLRLNELENQLAIWIEEVTSEAVYGRGYGLEVTNQEVTLEVTKQVAEEEATNKEGHELE